MSKNYAVILLWLVFISTGSTLYAQADSTNNDSLNTAILQHYHQNIDYLEQQRIADSTRKAELEALLYSLPEKDSAKKTTLREELRKLNEKNDSRLTRKKAQIDSLRANARAFPVTGFFNDTLFLIYSKLGSLSAQERAEAITHKIQKLAAIFNFNRDSLKLVESEITSDVVIGDNIIMSISENDALWSNSTRDELGRTYIGIIAQAVTRYQSETSYMVLAKEFSLALLVLVIMGTLIFYTRKLSGWIASRILGQEHQLIKGVTIKDYTLFDSKRQIGALLRLNKILKWVVILLLVYFALTIVFGIFPWTKDFTGILLGYIWNPLRKIVISFWNYLPNLITIIVILFVFRYVLKGIRFLKTEIARGALTLPGFYPDWANPTYQIIRVLVLAFMIVVIFPYLPGSESPVFKGVSVFIGFLFTFGSAGSLSNIVSGLVLTYMRLFKIGDRVKIGDVTGDVIERSLLVTRIRTIKNEIISIPNSTVMSNHTINFSSDAPEKGLIIHTTVTIGYDVPWRDMHQALIDAALKTEHVQKEPSPFVLQTGLNDFYVAYEINAYIKEAGKQAVIYSGLHQNIQDVCNERGIEILSPHYRAARDGNMTAIPASYLPKDYKAPEFKITITRANPGQE